jgi:molybdopterin-guanine dinucleotide biosynthesis protein A
MDSPKAWLEWHGSTLLARVASIVARVVDGPVVVVASPGQPLPPLPGGIEVVTDAVSGKGPLAGIAAGLAALRGSCEVTFVSSTDVPFLHTSFVRRVLEGCSEAFEVGVPYVVGIHQPLAAAYRPSVLPVAEAVLAGERRRVSLLFERCPTRRVDEAWLLEDPLVAALDPGLESVQNLNHPADYAQAVARPQPAVTLQHRGRSCLVRASTLAAAVRAVGAPLGGVVLLNGAPVPSGADPALVAGDTVVLA